jgi:anti-anti-sigma factor
MKVEASPQGSVTVLLPHGPLTRDEDEDFRRAAAPSLIERHGRVVADMSDVPYLDSCGIETLLELFGESSFLLRPIVACLNETCRDALDLTDVLPKLDVFDTVESALRSYSK